MQSSTKLYRPQIDRLVREEERLYITSISRSHAWVLEQKGLFPRRIVLGSRSVAWKLSELEAWIESRGQNNA
ncbi:AlpA family phage regulatory protein [Vibrio scophthalmi]|uniref:helix-turn-helix transcriptional regulator n=1 Tax=Vibrio scophthalmi TaxID=45658 RepID=UPI003873BBD9